MFWLYIEGGLWINYGVLGGGVGVGWEAGGGRLFSQDINNSSSELNRKLNF